MYDIRRKAGAAEKGQGNVPGSAGCPDCRVPAGGLRWESGIPCRMWKYPAAEQDIPATTDYLLREEYGTEELSAVDAVEKGALPSKATPFPRRKFRKDGSRRKRPPGPFDSRVHSQRYCPGRTSDHLSTMIRPFTSAVSADEHGNIWYTTGTGFSYSGFIEKYRLFAVVGILWLLLVPGRGAAALVLL